MLLEDRVPLMLYYDILPLSYTSLLLSSFPNVKINIGKFERER
jgi:hypothetical protein